MKCQTIACGLGLLALDLFFSNPAHAAAIVNQMPPGTSISVVGGGESYDGIATPDGRYVIYTSTANNLVATNSGSALAYVPSPVNVFERDRLTQSNILISINAAGTGGGNAECWPSAVSADGRYVLFDSLASDLVANDTNGAKDIFLRDTVNGVTSLVSVSTNGGVGNGESREATMTPDGRYVAFVSASSNLVTKDTNGIPDVFVRDMQAGTTVVASQGASNIKSTTLAITSEWPTISSDGRYVAFYSTAANLVTNSTASNDVYVRDLVSNVTIFASKGAHGVITSPASDSYAMSSNGQFIAFQTTGTSPLGVVFRYNVTNGATDIIATNNGEAGPVDHEERYLDISADGQSVVFVQGTNTNTAVELWNSQTRTNALISSGQAGAVDGYPRLDQSGRYVAFLGTDNLTTNGAGTSHIFVRDTFTGNVQMADVWTNNLPFSSMEVPFYFSAGGNLVVFTCFDGTIGLSPTKCDVFARDLGDNTSEVISAPAAGLASVTTYGAGRISTSSISSNGQFVAFASLSAGLVGSVPYGTNQIYEHNFATGSNALVSVAPDGLTPGNLPSAECAVSANGRYVAFSSSASNLVAGLNPTNEEIYLRDTVAGTTVMASVDPTGAIPGNGASSVPQLSANGQFVLFYSAANNLVSGGSAGYYWRDLQAGATYRIGATNTPAMTPDGSNVLYCLGSSLELWQAQTQSSTNVGAIAGVATSCAISPDGTRGAVSTSTAIYTVDLINHTNAQLGTYQGATWSQFNFSGDGRFLVNLVQDSYQTNQVYLYDFQNATNMLVSQAYGGSSGGNNKSDSATVSSTGRYVAYRSAASNLVPNDTNGVPDIFLYDRLTGATTLISVSQRDNWAANGQSLLPVFAGDGQTLFFESWASDLAPDNFNQWLDIFATPLSPVGVGGSTNYPPFQFTGLAVGITNSAATNANSVVLTWAAGPGAGYQVQFKNSLTDPQWQNLGGETVIGAQGQVIDLAPNGTQRFYRIVSF